MIQTAKVRGIKKNKFSENKALNTKEKDFRKYHNALRLVLMIKKIDTYSYISFFTRTTNLRIKGGK